MKLTLLFLIMGMGLVMAESSYSQTTTFSFKLNNKTVKEVLNEIEKSSEYVFFYNDAAVALDTKVHINVNGQTVDKILNELFKNSNVTYFIQDRQIFISKKDAANIEIANGIMAADEIEVTGKIFDEYGDPLPGANIKVDGSTRGVITDIDGTFTIKVKPSDKLVVTYLGLATQVVSLDGRRNLVINMKPQTSELAEVSIVGFGKQRKASVIGAISSVSAENLRMPVSKISNSLAGQMAGVVAVQRSGEPGAGADFWIRGVSSFGSSSKPMVLVDGIERDIELVDAEDIETFSILKDATATAVYGVRGANGVVLITTRKGKEGKPQVSARVEYGLLSPTKMPKMANAEQFINMYNQVNRDDTGKNFYSDKDIEKYLNGANPDLYPNVDWIDEIYKNTTTSQRVNINITGGNPTIRYYVAGSIYNENGVYNPDKGLGYKPVNRWARYNFRSNIDINLSKSTVVNVNLSNQYDVKREPNNNKDLWIYAFKTSPIAIPRRYYDGTIARPTIGENPYNLLNLNGYNQKFWNNAQSLIGVTQDFDQWVPGLKANVKFSWDAVNYAHLNRSKSPSTYYAKTQRGDDGYLEFAEYIKNNDGNDYLTLYKDNAGERITYLEASITYDNVFANVHRVGGLFLFNMREKINNFPGDYIAALPYRTQGIAARATYSYKDRYFVEGNFGYNGSENFAPKKRFGFFPSIALGYMISNESFWESLLPVVDLLKFRGSHGIIGNDQISPNRRFAFNSDMNQNAPGYAFGTDLQNNLGGIAVGYPGDDFVAWEEAKKSNIGLELGLFRSLKIQADYFYERRSGIFIQRASMPSVVGVPVQPFLNLGEMKNQGVDASLEYNKQFGDLFVSARANFTYNRNEKLFDDKAPALYKYRDVIGKPWEQYFGRVALGYFADQNDIATSPKQGKPGDILPGDVKYQDINGDGVIDDNDQVAIGYSNVPEFNYGFGVSLGYKGFDLSLFFQGIGHISGIMSGTTLDFSDTNLLFSNVYEDVALNHWSKDNPDPNAKYPRLARSGSENNKKLSTRNIVDKSFMRLKNMEFGYTIPKHIMKKAHMNSLRIYVQGVNLLTFSKFKLWDPEIADAQGSMYPNMRVINLGLNLNF